MTSSQLSLDTLGTPDSPSRRRWLVGAMTAEVPVKGGSHRGNFLASLFGDASSLAGRNNTVDWFRSLLQPGKVGT